MLSCSQLLWHSFSPDLMKRQIVHVSAPDFLFGGGRRQHDLQEASGKGEGGKNRSWFYGGNRSGIRAVQGFDESPHELLSLCNAGKQAVTIHPSTRADEQLFCLSLLDHTELLWASFTTCTPARFISVQCSSQSLKPGRFFSLGCPRAAGTHSRL